MSANKHATGTDWIDPDDAPELTDQFFEEADEYLGDTLVRRGKPKGTDNRLATTIRLDPEIVNFFKAQGAGWQTHINTALRAPLKIPLLPLPLRKYRNSLTTEMPP